MFTVKTLQPSDSERWDHFVQAHAYGTIYHTAAWSQAIQNTYRHRPLYLVLENAAGAITAGLPLFIVKSRITGNRLVSLPAAQACNPLVSSQEQYEQLIDHALDYASRHGIRAMELKTDAQFRFRSDDFGRASGSYSTYILDLSPGLPVLEAALHPSNIRRKIKKAHKSNLELVTGTSPDDVKIFYGLFLKMRRHYGLLPPPLQFFVNLRREFQPQGAIDILHAKHEGEVISSLLLLKYKDTVTYEYGASEFAKYSLGASPFLLWEAIKRAKHAGFMRFDFGRTADDDIGLAQFKQRWGARQEMLRYYYLPDFSHEVHIRQSGLSKRLMAYSMHALPASMCQWAGSLLYRNFV